MRAASSVFCTLPYVSPPKKPYRLTTTAPSQLNKKRKKDVEAILDAHYLGRDVQLAEAAVLKLEQRTKL